MRPIVPIQGSGNCDALNTETSSNLFVCHPGFMQLSRFSHSFFCELGVMMLRTSRLFDASDSISVQAILARRHPFKIIDPVVCLLSIFVIGLFCSNRLSVEMAKNQSTQSEIFSGSIRAVQPHHSIAIVNDWRLYKTPSFPSSASNYSSHSPKAGDLVMRIIDHDAPFFIHVSSISGNITKELV